MGSYGSNAYGFVPTVGVVEQPEGARVAAPAKPWSCWAVVTKLRSITLKTPRSCQARARSGFCTCTAHRAWEDEARAHRAALEAGDANESKGRAQARRGNLL